MPGPLFGKHAHPLRTRPGGGATRPSAKNGSPSRASSRKGSCVPWHTTTNHVNVFTLSPHVGAAYHRSLPPNSTLPLLNKPRLRHPSPAEHIAGLHQICTCVKNPRQIKSCVCRHRRRDPVVVRCLGSAVLVLPRRGHSLDAGVELHPLFFLFFFSNEKQGTDDFFFFGTTTQVTSERRHRRR